MSSSSPLPELPSGKEHHFETKSGKVLGKVNITETMGACAIILSSGLLMGSVLAAAGVISGPIFGWAMLGGSVAVTVLSFGVSTPITLTTSILAILSLTGTLAYTTAGLGIAITTGIGLFGLVSVTSCC